MNQRREARDSDLPTPDRNAILGNDKLLRAAGALSGAQLWTRLTHPNPADRLVIMPPICDRKAVIDASSIDVRLGNEFIFMRKGELATLTFGRDLRSVLHRFYERTYVGCTHNFMLHPGDLVLGATLEYFRFPKDLMAYVVGRSSWGRLGLVIATATVVHPGYKGCLTLELINDGNIPIQLYPGSPIPIAQLAVHPVGPGQGAYRGRYSGWVGSTGPGFSRIHTGRDFKKWLRYRRKRTTEEAP